MSANDSNANSPWTEPPWSGFIDTTQDALLILEAARRGLIPRVTRRLVDAERKMITSGSVFVFDEDESGIKRWTDGFFWSPSRILGNFLLYRETEKRGAGHRSARADQANADDGENTKADQSLSRPKSDSSRMGVDRQRERSLVGSLTNSYKFKPGGMMKKTFSLTIGGVSQHLISYYKIEDVEQGRLRSPSSLPELASLTISPEYLDKTHFRNPPKVEIGVDGIPRYRGEADDADTSPRLLPAPLANPSAYYTDVDAGPSKRTKRYEPYASTSPTATQPKRTRKKNNSAGSQQEATGDSPVSSTQSPYDSSAPTHTYAPYSYYPTTTQQYHVSHAYSPAPYPPAAPATTPPQDSPSPPATSAPYQPSSYSAESPSSTAPAPAASPVYSSYYPSAAPHYGYAMPWPTGSYAGYAASSGHGGSGAAGGEGGDSSGAAGGGNAGGGGA